MIKPDIGIESTMAGLIIDAQYRTTVRMLCQRARRRIYASVFIVELVSDSGLETEVIKLLDDLMDAYNRSVDVRLMIGGSSQNIDIQDKTEAALVHCRRLGIPCHLVALQSEKSSHKKIVVADNYVLIGSHNWSPGSFRGQTQDSVLVQDARLAAYFAHQLAQDWRNLESEDDNV